MTDAEEEAFWAAVRAQFPQAFVDPDIHDPDDATAAPGGWSALAGVGLTRVVDAEALREVHPDGLLLDVLDGLDPYDLDRVGDLALLEVVAAWQRVASMAHAGAARAAAALSRRACLQVPAEPVPVGRGLRRYTTLRAAGTEIAIRTGCSVRAGELLARDGRLFEGALLNTGDALARGEIDPGKARRLADRLGECPLPTALEVQAAVLPGAGLRSPAQLDRDLTRALIEVDAAEAEDPPPTRPDDSPRPPPARPARRHGGDLGGAPRRPGRPGGRDPGRRGHVGPRSRRPTDAGPAARRRPGGPRGRRARPG